MSVNINPRKIVGAWDKGYSLDVHTLESRLLGYNDFGHAEFSTKRSPLGELLFRLKYRAEDAGVGSIVETALEFIEEWGIKPNILVPVPPSNTSRARQPVIVIAKQLAEGLEIKFSATAVKKVKQTGQIKNETDFSARIDALSDAFEVDEEKVSDKRVLLFDDLYQSGATLNAVARALKEQGEARAVYALTLTKTRNG